MEIEFGVITQHISSPTMEKAIGQRGAYMVIDNVLLKTNLKLGGVNHGFATGRVMSQFQHDVVANEWMAESRMFIGIDVSHAAPQSLYERKTEMPCSEPTIVGMAYTVGHPVKMLGTYWMQNARVAHVQNLKRTAFVAMTNYRDRVGRFPVQIIVYRGGLSEGEYRIILTHEERAFADAFEELQQTEKEFRKPSLTIVVIQRDSNYRVVPFKVDDRAKPAEQNVRPGTCVDRGIMHPTLTEFLLIPHKAIQGTAKPIRCTVIWDTVPGRMSEEELKNVTNGMCYAHGIVTSPVSVPAPLYSAGDLAKRGKNNLKTFSCNGDEDSAAGGVMPNDGTEEFFADISGRLAPGIPTKFWA